MTISTRSSLSPAYDAVFNCLNQLCPRVNWQYWMDETRQAVVVQGRCLIGTSVEIPMQNLESTDRPYSHILKSVMKSYVNEHQSQYYQMKDRSKDFSLQRAEYLWQWWLAEYQRLLREETTR